MRVDTVIEEDTLLGNDELYFLFRSLNSLVA